MITSLLVSAMLFTSTHTAPVITDADAVSTTDTIAWMHLEDVNKIITKNIKKNKAKEVKLVLVDFYTDWCGWCKKLDTETYRDPEVAALMNKYFYPVKFDAEQKDSVAFANKMYKYDATAGRGTNGFALEMAARPGGRLGYPTITIIGPMGEKIAVEAGYKNPEKMKLMLLYYGEGHYKTKDFTTFQTEYNQKQLSD